MGQLLLERAAAGAGLCHTCSALLLLADMHLPRLLVCAPLNSQTQVVALLQRMGLDMSVTRAIKRANLTGAELLLLSEHQLVTLLDIPLHKARRLHRLQVRSAAAGVGVADGGAVVLSARSCLATPRCSLTRMPPVCLGPNNAGCCFSVRRHCHARRAAAPDRGGAAAVAGCPGLQQLRGGARAEAAAQPGAGRP